MHICFYPNENRGVVCNQRYAGGQLGGAVFKTDYHYRGKNYLFLRPNPLLSAAEEHRGDVEPGGGGGRGAAAGAQARRPAPLLESS